MPKLERFAELVAAAEREKLSKKIAALEADVDHFFKLSGQYLERANNAEEAVALERERCAKLCEEIEMNAHALWDRTADPEAQGRWIGAADCVAAIRGMK